MCIPFLYHIGNHPQFKENDFANNDFVLDDQEDGLTWIIQLSDIHLREKGFTTDSFKFVLSVLFLYC
jgi:hypothetical protein